MILLKSAVLIGIQVLVVLANPTTPHYPLSNEQKTKLCEVCSNYLLKPINGFPLVPLYPELNIIDQNLDTKCGQVKKNGVSDMKNNNVTETKYTKIVGGSDALPNEFPWMVGLAFGYGSEIVCGGSIISSQSIVTAAHCVKDVKVLGSPIKKCIWAVVKEHNTMDTNEGEMWNRICDVEVHPEYKGTIIENGWFTDNIIEYNHYDFAVLTLCWELIFTPKVSPVCLPQPLVEDTYDPYVGTEVIMSGWGLLGIDKDLAHTLQKIQMKTLSNAKCFDDKLLPRRTTHNSKICAYDAFGGSKGDQGGCHGDSGGPLVTKKNVENEEINILVGVVSYGGNSKCEKNEPTVCARVTEVMKWLTEKDTSSGKFKYITGTLGKYPEPPKPPVGGWCSVPITKNSKSLKNSGGVTYYHFEKDKKLSRKKAQETCESKYGGQLTSINTQDEYEWIKEQVKDLKMFGQIAIGGQWKDKSSRKFEWTDKSEMDMSVLNANWFRTRNYQFPSYKNKKRINLELWYSRRAMGFANALDHKAPTMYICKVAKSCSSCSSCA